MLGCLRLWCLPCAHGSSPPLAGYEVAYQCGHALLIDALRTWQGGFNVPLLSQRHRDDKIGLAQEYLLLETDYSQSPREVENATLASPASMSLSSIISPVAIAIAEAASHSPSR
jgi:hypothetical protein